MAPTYLPSPSTGVLHVGPVPLRAYAFCIIAGVILAVKVSEPRARARGIDPRVIGDVAVWAVPMALIGARIYHVITSPDAYFGAGGNPVGVFEVWKGGLGVWGGVLFGVGTGWIWSKRHGLDPYVMADVVAPGIAVGQAVGRLGNYFNQELFGRPTTLPWGLLIDPGRVGTVPGAAAYQPTFLYELLWDLGVAALCIWAGRRFVLKRGQTMALYVMAYTAGRAWIEALRIDPAHHFLGLRVNDYVSIVVFLGGAVAFWMLGRRAQPETDPQTGTPETEPAAGPLEQAST